MQPPSNPPADSLKVVLSPYPSLTQISQSVEMTSDGFAESELIQNYCNRMTSLLEGFRGSGIGLSANQVGLLWRIFVCMDNLNENTNNGPIRAYVNPRIISASTDTSIKEEGCLSFPGVIGNVSRPEDIELEYYDIDGVHQITKYTGLQARCCLHEINHLDGINIPNHFDEQSIKRNALRLNRLGYRFHSH